MSFMHSFLDIIHWLMQSNYSSNLIIGSNIPKRTTISSTHEINIDIPHVLAHKYIRQPQGSAAGAQPFNFISFHKMSLKLLGFIRYRDPPFCEFQTDFLGQNSQPIWTILAFSTRIFHALQDCVLDKFCKKFFPKNNFWSR